MSNTVIGLAGIGKLGTSMLKHWDKQSIQIGLYHHNEDKVNQMLHTYPNSFSIKKEELCNLSFLILALPAHKIVPFIQELPNQNPNLTFINMATSLDTKDLIKEFPHLKFISMKFMGHSKNLLNTGKGLFVTEKKPTKEIKQVFKAIGEIAIDDPMIVQKVNKEATYFAIKSAIELEKALSKESISNQYYEQVLESLVPEVVRSYKDGKLGHFGNEIAKKIRESE